MATGTSEVKWKTLFDNMQAKTEAALAKKSKPSKPAVAAPIQDGGDGIEMPEEISGGGGAGNKRLSVERIYQKKTQLEHILLRPDTYIGSVESVTQAMWVMDTEANQMVQKDITYVPGLYKIFDEIIVNAADNKQRDPKMDCLKVEIDPEQNKIKVWNNGKGIPVVEHKTEKMYVPTMIFGHLLTSSNYDDSEKKVTGGRNGYGAKLCNIFSKKFIVETSAKDYKKAFKQTWTDNMGKTKEPTITDAKESDFTSVTFYPDLEKFKMEKLDDDVVALFTRRAYDIAASAKGVKVFLNGKRLPVKGFKDYIDLYLKDKTDETGAPLKMVHEVVNERWEVAVAMSEKGFQQVSFVNSIATTKGGRHVEYVADQCVSKLIEVVRKKNKGGVAIKPFQVKNHLWVFISCLIENPTFDSQTKENMTKQAKSFGSKCQLSEKFINQVSKCGIVESILSWMKFKAQAQLNKKCHSSKHSKLKGIPKLDDANDAGTRNSHACTLILTEGDSAKSLAVAGLGVIGRDRYGVFPLRGKLLNVREATHKQIMDNAEINNVIKIIGLHFKENYDDPTKLSQLRYGKLMIMTDQDQDGSHIKGLLINFIHHFWPSLLRHNFVEEFITPIVKVSKGKEEKSFYSMPEFEEWKRETENWHTYKVKYYKGLGTSTSKEAKEYFSDMQRHRIPFHYGGGEDDTAINLAFSKKKVEERKEWLTNHMEEKKRRTEMGLPELYLYGKNTRSISFSDFVNRELILFSNTDIIRSIPSLMDGFKPGQRKVIFTCIKRNLTNKELKVAQLAGSVAEQSAYHHGENALMGTIINLAQNFVGSNNLNLLQPLGQFGTRIHGGKDAASPRYIFTMLSPLTRHILNVHDDALLNHLYDDNQKIEPEWYCPIIPTVLVNGAEGIGTGWSTKIPNYDVREIVANIRRMLDGLDPLPMIPSFKNFKGVIEDIGAGDGRFAVHGEISILDDTTLEITELPIRTWTQNYKEDVLEVMLHGTEKQPPIITDYKEYNTDTTVKFVVKMAADKLAHYEHEGLHKLFKLSTTISTNTMVLFNHEGCIKRYEKVEDIMLEFYATRLEFYQRRKDYLEGMLGAESLKLDNIARFIMEKIEGTVVVENKPKKELIQMLVKRGYDSDPVKAWKDSQNKGKDDLLDAEEEEEESTSGPDFNYLLSMPLWNLTKEKKEELLKQRDQKADELRCIRKKTPKDLWREDLMVFEEMLKETERIEKEEGTSNLKPVKLAKLGAKAPRGPKKAVVDTLPSPAGIRVVPKINLAVKVKGERDAAKKLFKGKAKKDAAEGEDDNQGSMLDFVKKEENGSPVSSAVGAASSRGRGAGRGGRGRGRGAAAAGTTKEKGKKGGKKKNPWSDSEGSDNISDVSELDGEEKFTDLVIPRDTARRAAAAKVNYNFDNEEEIESDDDDDAGFKAYDAETGEYADGETEEKSPEKPTTNGKISDDESDNVVMSSDEEAKKPKPKPKAAKPKAPPKPKAPKETTAPKKPAAKPAAAKKAAKKTDLPDLSSDEDEEKAHSKIMMSNKELYPSTDEEDDDEMFKPKASKKPAAKPAPKKKAVLVSDSDSSPAKPAKKAAPKKRAAIDSDSDTFVPKKKAAAAASKKKSKKGSDSDDDLADNFSPPAPRATAGGRAKAPVKYNFSSDEEDDDFE
ncbi:DNA topoisomerase 2 [Plakobranchus ocellatus]|uniref:DNA topoisomerase 2 n=1 Tax=Plakobranchus ocellatus TaxID=259542 RepID=A0AAV4BGL4_9GAST|nr:DNA topoisomerase 2 [Plakobranchus ocellatus]